MSTLNESHTLKKILSNFKYKIKEAPFSKTKESLVKEYIYRVASNNDNKTIKECTEEFKNEISDEITELYKNNYEFLLKALKNKKELSQIDKDKLIEAEYMYKYRTKFNIDLALSIFTHKKKNYKKENITWYSNTFTSKFIVTKKVRVKNIKEFTGSIFALLLQIGISLEDVEKYVELMLYNFIKNGDRFTIMMNNIITRSVLFENKELKKDTEIEEIIIFHTELLKKLIYDNNDLEVNI